MDLEERGHAKAGELWDVALENFLNITWSDKVCSEEVLRRVGEERVISFINRRQRVWLGHTLIHGDRVPLVIEGRIPGKRPPGRP